MSSSRLSIAMYGCQFQSSRFIVQLQSRTVTRRAALRRGRFTVTLKIPRALARAKTAKVTVRYAGDPDTAPASSTIIVR